MSKIHDQLRAIGFIAADRFWELDPGYWGGCGPGKWGDPFVPDHIIGLDIKPCCAAHDVSWELAVENQSLDDKYQGDFEFYINMRKFVEVKEPTSFKWVTWLRYKLVHFYFDRVWYHVPLKLRYCLSEDECIDLQINTLLKARTKPEHPPIKPMGKIGKPLLHTIDFALKQKAKL
jgi:hypothetical protein